MVFKNPPALAVGSINGMNPTSISRLRVRRYLNRIDGDVLNALCKALKCQPGDLMMYEEDEADT
jgi:putative transcriptional regulator